MRFDLKRLKRDSDSGHSVSSDAASNAGISGTVPSHTSAISATREWSGRNKVLAAAAVVLLLLVLGFAVRFVINRPSSSKPPISQHHEPCAHPRLSSSV
jgi:hypothetical protein